MHQKTLSPLFPRRFARSLWRSPGSSPLHQVLPWASCSLPVLSWDSLGSLIHEACKGAPGTFPPLHQHHDTIALKGLDMLMNKKAGENKDTLCSKKGWTQCYFIHLWDFIIKFNALIYLAFSKHILVFSLKIFPWQSLRILHVCLGFPDVLQPASC